MSKPTIYLAGPMSGLTWRQALEWRKEAEYTLNPHWRLLSPVRAQIPEEKLDEQITVQSQEDKDLALWHTATGVTAQDEFFIDQSDWLLVNFLNAERVSVGTVWEMGYGWGQNKKILTVVKKGSIHDHPFVRRRSHLFVEDFEEALDFFQAISIAPA